MTDLDELNVLKEGVREWKRNTTAALEETVKRVKQSEYGSDSTRREYLIKEAVRLAFEAFPYDKGEKYEDKRMSTRVMRAIGYAYTYSSFTAWTSMNAVLSYPSVRNVSVTWKSVEADANAGTSDAYLHQEQTFGLWRKVRIPAFDLSVYKELAVERFGKNLSFNYKIGPADVQRQELHAHYVSGFVVATFKCLFCTGYIETNSYQRVLYSWEAPTSADTKVACAYHGRCLAFVKALGVTTCLHDEFKTSKCTYDSYLLHV